MSHSCFIHTGALPIARVGITREATGTCRILATLSQAFLSKHTRVTGLVNAFEVHPGPKQYLPYKEGWEQDCY